MGQRVPEQARTIQVEAAPEEGPGVPRGDTAADGCRTAAAAAAATAAPGELVGVTVWRLRRSKASDSGDSRLLVQETENQRTESVEWTPERVEAETPFAAGDRVRLSIESPRAGYLYVVDRELYADGTTSDPYLIFPTRRMRDGDNSVRAGKVIELPDKSAFKLTPLRADYQGERLTILRDQRTAAAGDGAGQRRAPGRRRSSPSGRRNGPRPPSVSSSSAARDGPIPASSGTRLRRGGC